MTRAQSKMSHTQPEKRQLRNSIQKSGSCSHITLETTTSAYDLLHQTLLHDLKTCIPTLVKTEVQTELQAAFKKRDELKLEISALRKEKSDLANKVDGYKKQVDQWVKLVTVMENETLPSLVDKINNLETNWSNKEKTLTTKTNHYISTQNKVQKEVAEITNIQKQWEDLLKAKTEGAALQNLEKSQEFVSAEYEDFKKSQNILREEVSLLKTKVSKQAAKSEHNSNYSRFDSADFKGIPVVPVDQYGNENCKQMIINICKEMNYWLPASSISTAHRLKKHPSKPGPPDMIVKFNSRDIRNDVFRLRNQIKHKVTWNCYPIKKLYINESLTPEARKLFYLTRACAKELENTHGKVYTWTFKGEVYLRKNIEGGPKRKISSEECLTKIKNGDILLDPPTTSENVPESIVIIEDVMAEYNDTATVDT